MSASTVQALDAEFQACSLDGHSDANDSGECTSDWAKVWQDHPLRERADDPRPCRPIALYLDGIQYTRSSTPGHGDSLVAVTAYELSSQKRHLLYVLSKKEAAGHDTLTAVWHHLRWALESCATGIHPTHRWDGADWMAGSKYAALAGQPMSCRWLVCQLKSDWAEISSSLGFPSWSSFHRPCMQCSANKSNWYNWNGITLDDLPDSWGEMGFDYETACANSERRIVVTDEVRVAILHSGQLSFSSAKKRPKGRYLKQDVLALGLLKGDRLEPDSRMVDTADFDTRPVPFECTFWRRHVDGRGRILDRVLRRCPLFSVDILGTSPQVTLHTDTLHCLYLGIMSRYCHAVVWGALSSNLWDLSGDKESRQEMGCRLLFSDFTRWCDKNGVAGRNRVKTLTIGMVSAEDSTPALKMKAAETGVFTRWACEFVEKHKVKITHGDLLASAGNALLEYKRAIDEAPFAVPWKECSRMMDLCLRHLHLMKCAGISDIPKCHQFLHMVADTRIKGNPTGYSCFTDESLNLSIARCASAASRVCWEAPIFQRVRLIPYLDKSSHFACV